MQYSTHLLRHKRLIIGKNIHYHRSRQKLPLRRLAKLAELPMLLLDHYELGKNEILLDHLLRISCALNVELEALLRDNNGGEQVQA